MQATAGILVVHARLDARIALRGKAPENAQYRRAAFVAVSMLLAGAVAMLMLCRWWLALALVLTATGYTYDLRRQQNAAELQRPLMSVGRQALTLATIYALLLVAGLLQIPN